MLSVPGRALPHLLNGGSSIATDGTVADATSVQSGGFGNSLAMDLRGGINTNHMK